MMLPATANRFQPALSVIQAGTYARERAMREDAQAANGGVKLVGGMAQAAPTPPKDMQAINEYYFGLSITPMEAMFALVEKTVDYLNDRLSEGRDGDPKRIEAGNKWRDEALQKPVAVGSAEDYSIPKPGENGVSFRSVAKLIRDSFKSEYLNADQDLRKLLEDTVGFRLHGMSVTDLLDAFIEPESDAAKRVYETISEGLAGQAGSKASQRMEAATEGPKSVEDTVAAQRNKSSIDVVDEETIAEDQKAIKAAQANEKLDEAAAIPEKVEEALKEVLEDIEATDGDQQAIAAAAIQALTGLGAAVGPETASEVDVGKIAIPEGAAEKLKIKAPGLGNEPETKSDKLRGVLAHYLEFVETSSANDDKQQKFSIRL